MSIACAGTLPNICVGHSVMKNTAMKQQYACVDGVLRILSLAVRTHLLLSHACLRRARDHRHASCLREGRGPGDVAAPQAGGFLVFCSFNIFKGQYVVVSGAAEVRPHPGRENGSWLRLLRTHLRTSPLIALAIPRHSAPHRRGT